VEVSIALAFAAGLVSFASPCVLALLPVYIAFLGSAAAGPVTASGELTAPAPRSGVLAQAALFVTGFSVLFIVLGVSIGLLGAPLLAEPWVVRVAGVLVMGLGIVTTGVFGPLLGRMSVGLDPGILPTGRSVRSLFLGALVAVGWTPCIGPVLGAILTMGASSGSAPVAAMLLLAYSAGLALPFLAAAAGLPRMRPVIDLLRRHHRPVEIVSGGLIFGIGVLIFFDVFARLAGLFTFGL
jgi:cytochrome c-type biogenesis protein